MHVRDDRTTVGLDDQVAVVDGATVNLRSTTRHKEPHKVEVALTVVCLGGLAVCPNVICVVHVITVSVNEPDVSAGYDISIDV